MPPRGRYGLTRGSGHGSSHVAEPPTYPSFLFPNGNLPARRHRGFVSKSTKENTDRLLEWPTTAEHNSSSKLSDPHLSRAPLASLSENNDAVPAVVDSSSPIPVTHKVTGTSHATPQPQWSFRNSRASSERTIELPRSSSELPAFQAAQDTKTKSSYYPFPETNFDANKYGRPKVGSKPISDLHSSFESHVIPPQNIFAAPGSHLSHSSHLASNPVAAQSTSTPHSAAYLKSAEEEDLKVKLARVHRIADTPLSLPTQPALAQVTKAPIQADEKEDLEATPAQAHHVANIRSSFLAQSSPAFRSRFLAQSPPAQSPQALIKAEVEEDLDTKLARIHGLLDSPAPARSDDSHDSFRELSAEEFLALDPTTYLAAKKSSGRLEPVQTGWGRKKARNTKAQGGPQNLGEASALAKMPDAKKQAPKPTPEETAARLKKVQESAIYTVRRNIARGTKHKDRGTETTALEVLDRIRNANIDDNDLLEPPSAALLPVLPTIEPHTVANSKTERLEVKPSDAAARSFEPSLSIIGPHVVIGPSPEGNRKARNSRWATHSEIEPVKAVEETGSNAWGSEVPGVAGSSDSNVPVLHGHYIAKADPGCEMQLANFDGSFTPPPVDWEGRPIFDNRAQWFTESIGEWIMTFNVFSYEGGQQILAKTIKPTSQSFLDGTAHPDGRTMYVPDISHPACLVDPSDNLSMRLKNENANTLSRRYRAIEMKKEKDMKASNKHTVLEVLAFKPEPNPHKPKANIYLRPAERRDASAIKDILNWYSANTPRVPDLDSYNDNEIRRRIADCGTESLPCLVAVERGVARQFNHYKEEKIVGYALATDFTGRSTQDRYTAELELYVHPDHLRLGVGKSLMDKLIEACDTGFIARQGYMFTCDKEVNTNYGAGGIRYLTNVIFVLRYMKCDPRDYKWTKEWLMRMWDFKESALLEETGVKFNRYVNASYLVRRTGWDPGDGHIP